MRSIGNKRSAGFAGASGALTGESGRPLLHGKRSILKRGGPLTDAASTRSTGEGKLESLDFPDHSFDLVNARFLVAFLPRTSWPTFIAECVRVLRPGGTLRLTEPEVNFTTSAALNTNAGYLAQAMKQAGLGFLHIPTYFLAPVDIRSSEANLCKSESRGENDAAMLNHPENPDSQQREEQHSSPVIAESRAQVLIVEDNPQMSRMIAAILAPLYRVITACDGQDGLEQTLALHPDLILCDVSMPRMSGEQLVTVLRAQPDFDDVPILVLSGRTDEQLRIQLLRAGAQDYLIKPFNREELRLRVANLLVMRQVRQVLQREVTVQSRDLVTLASKVTLQQRELTQALSLLREREARVQDQAKELEVRGRQLERANKALTTRNRQLDHMQSRLRAIVDTSQDAMLFLTPDGIPAEVNTRFTDFFGIDASTVLSQPADHLTALLKAQFAAEVSLDEALAWSTTDQERIFGTQQVQMEPTRREFELFSLPVLNLDQTYIGRLYVWRDVTHEREVDRMKSEFVCLASHELRTPLTSIKGYVDLLLTDETVGELSELQREFLGIAQNNARRLMKITNDLLDLSRMESGKMELHRQPLDVNLLIHKLMPSFQPGWDAKRQKFTLHLPEEAPIVLGDAEGVMQILSNLLSNAHKYTPEEGHIDLSVETVGPVAWMSVTDSGIGLSTEEQAQLFTRFYRAHNAATEAVGGTGLGLVITRSMVEMQGGEMQVSSEPGHGSTFRFTLPLAESLGGS